MRKKLLLLGIFALASQLIYSQGSPDYNGGLKMKFDEEGNKYLRVITWAQTQANFATDPPSNTNNISFNLRRARVLLFSQINKKFMILTHVGLNSLNSGTLSPTGKGTGSQLFLHGAWVQYAIHENHTIGSGLHYYNGISRLNNQSTLNMMTMDNNRQSWSTIGLTDQFARHNGIFGKGKFGKLQYRVAVNDVITNGLDTRDVNTSAAIYGGRRILGSQDAGMAFTGYFDYNLLDQESNFLPYKVGSYLGGKKVFNVGAGFFMHPNGSITMKNDSALNGENVMLFSVDAFYDAPVGENGAAITAYASFQSNNYGKDYFFSAYGTGSMVYGHIGYLFAGDVAKTRYQPYASFGLNTYDAVDDNRTILGVGVNAYMSGHNSKLTLQYQQSQFGSTNTGTVSLQAMIYI